jgi:hypothetical protein
MVSEIIKMTLRLLLLRIRPQVAEPAANVPAMLALL